jgi:hypothetical protein
MTATTACRTLVFVALLLVPVEALAWGSAAHRYITARALDLLPAPLKPFFDAHRDEIVLRSTDPDLWRSAGWEDDPNHFMDFGVPEYGRYPFAELPREYGAAIEKFGIATLRRNGLLPWREAEEFGNLRRAMERRGPYVATDIVLFSAVAAHYIQDAHQPLHATNNYDGALTDQRGVHARFETDLFERFRERLTIEPDPPRAILNVRDFAFDALLASYSLVPAVLDADRGAIAGRGAYDDVYFERFFAGARSVLESRLRDAITATASIITSAWEQAGRPAIRP